MNSTKIPLESPAIVDQLEEALEERQGSDRRKQDVGTNPTTGVDHRTGDRRDKNDTDN